MAEPCVPVRIDHLCCPICSQLLRNPVTVPCGHNFCLKCIQDYWDCVNSIRCPACGGTFSCRPQLIRNTTLAEMVRDAERRTGGSERRNQQDTGASLHDTKRCRTSVEETTPESNLCKRHNSCLDAYCYTDKLMLCSLCAAEHQGHKIGSVLLERKRKQEQLKDMQIKSRQILQQQERECENMRKILQEMKKEAKQTEDCCDIAVSSAVDCLQRHYLSVKQLIGAQEQAVTTQVQHSLQTLQVEMERTKSRDVKLELLAQTESDICFLQEWSSLLRTESQPRHEALEDPLRPFKNTKRVVEEIGRQLENFCDKEFTSLFSQSNGGGEQQGSAGGAEEGDTWEANNSQPYDVFGDTRAHAEQNVEPTTRTQFLQYACELTLDPGTAHRDLVISPGDKEVKLSPQPDRLPSVRSLERFLRRRQVLCREALQAERCYYEVEVEGDKAEIALAYKGIDRKSSTVSSGFGGNENSWSLDRFNIYSVSHDNVGIELTRAPSHNRIGVYLKFREGTLTFYEASEASDSMTFLYRVEDKFREPLYPGFWLGEKCCIRICDLNRGSRNNSEI